MIDYKKISILATQAHELRLWERDCGESDIARTAAIKSFHERIFKELGL